MSHIGTLSLATALSALLVTAAVAQPPPSDQTQAPAAAPAAAPASATTPAAAGAADPAAGQGTFASRCAVCHDSGAGGAPDRATLAMKAPDDIFNILKSGPMQAMASGLSDGEMHNVAAFLTTPAK